jgi:pyruvate/2-oxoglutarate dehydrogenase complex dihydrolipoamide acyltransferase (E2) component
MIVEVIIDENSSDAAGEGVIVAWLVRSGERVQHGAVLAELMYEKTSVEIVAPAAGCVTILVAAEAPVRAGSVIASIQTDA